MIWSNFGITQITWAAALRIFCNRSHWYLGMPYRRELQQWRCDLTKAWTRVLVDSSGRNFLVYVMVYRPRKASLQTLTTWVSIDIWLSNHVPRLRTHSTGFITAVSTAIDSMQTLDNYWQEPMVRNSVFVSLINRRWEIIQMRTAAIHSSITLIASLWQVDESGLK